MAVHIERYEFWHLLTHVEFIKMQTPGFLPGPSLHWGGLQLAVSAREKKRERERKRGIWTLQINVLGPS